jgi:hypothetical protein
MHDAVYGIRNVFYGGPGGSRTRVQNPFQVASYSNKFVVYTTEIFMSTSSNTIKRSVYIVTV